MCLCAAAVYMSFIASWLIKQVGSADCETPAQDELMAITTTSASTLIFLSRREMDCWRKPQFEKWMERTKHLRQQM